MSGDDHVVDHPESDDERRVASAMSAFGAEIRTDPGAWEQIDARLDDRGGHRVRGGGSGLVARPLLVAAAAVVLLVIAGTVGVRARSTVDEIQVATAPATETSSIVAVDTEGRLVELDADGTQRRVIYQPGSMASGEHLPLTGPIAVAPGDGTVYAERNAPEPCGDSSDVIQFHEIVAIPFAGGEPRVVAPVGDHPAVLPGGERLAYVTTPDRRTCSPLTASPEIEVVDLRTGELGSFAPFDFLPLTEGPASDDPQVGETEPRVVPADSVLGLAGDADGALLVLVQPPHRAGGPVVERLTFDEALRPLLVETSGSLGAVLPSGPLPTGTVLYVDSIEPLAGAGRFVFSGRTRERTVLPDGTAAYSGEQVIEVFEATRQPGDGEPLGTEVAFRLDEDSSGLLPIAVTGLSNDPTSGRLLVSVWGVSPAGGNRLLLWNGSSLSVIGSSYQSAVWYRSPVPDAPPPTDVDTIPAVTTSNPPGTGTSSTLTRATTTTVARSTTPPYPSTTDTPVDVVGTSDRPEDAAAVVDAFRGFFEQGDRAALEASGVLEPAFEEGERSVPGGGQGVTVTIDDITFTGSESAEVRFRMDKDGNFFTAPTVGSAVFVDGRWKVSAATMCTLLSRVQIPCPAGP